MTTTRRQFLGWGARAAAGLAGLGAAGFAGYEWPSGTKPAPAVPSPATTTPGLSPGEPADDTSEVYRFYTRPDLEPPRAWAVRASGSFKLGGGTVARQVLVTPKGYGGPGPGQQGLMMLDGDARLRWFVPTTKAPFDLQYQQYKGRPVLTWWEGDVADGYGTGEGVVADMSLQEIARLGPVEGLQPDLHELNITPEGTALMTAYHGVPADLSSVKGPSKGYLLGAVAMEVDISTGKLVHRWESVDHVAVGETYQALTGGTEKLPFDYFHINSIALAPDGDLLISARNTWTVYKVDRSSGKVKWRLNGKNSDFTMAKESQFYWQHHVRQHPGGRLTLFDDGASPAEEAQSRALILDIDETHMTCQLGQSFVHPAGLLVPNQGSVQLLDDGTIFVGWGAEPYFSRFAANGELLVDGRFPTNIESYRAFVADLRTTPTDKPVVVVGTNPPGGSSVYVSWNGCTEVVAWRVLAGAHQGQLSAAATAEWSGFETAVTVGAKGPYFQAVALDGAGREIGSSHIVKI